MEQILIWINDWIPVFMPIFGIVFIIATGLMVVRSVAESMPEEIMTDELRHKAEVLSTLLKWEPVELPLVQLETEKKKNDESTSEYLSLGDDELLIIDDKPKRGVEQ